VRVEELGYTLDRQILALDGNEDRIGRGKRIERQKIERRRAVDYDEGVFLENRPNRLFQAIFAIIHRHELDGGAHEILIGRNDIESIDLGIDRHPLDWLIED